MKMTMHIDEEILAEVVKITGVASKTKAVELALSELVRRHKLKEVLRKGMGMTSAEIAASWEDPEEDGLRAAEEPAKYGKRSTRR